MYRPELAQQFPLQPQIPPPTYKDLPGDFPYTSDWLVDVANSERGDKHPWEACIKPLVEAHYFRIHQIERLAPESIFEICKEFIKLPTAVLMKDYAEDDCRTIRILKARRS